MDFKDLLYRAKEGSRDAQENLPGSTIRCWSGRPL